MKKKDIYTLVTLIVFTIITALFATTYHAIKYVTFIILALSIVKFLLVAFQFMELKKAHVFWKIILVTYLSLFLIIVMIML
jgi:hypothetical protein